MNKIALIFPYYGKYPNYFNLWLKTAEYNPNIDYIFFTDRMPSESFPPNIIWNKMSFQELKDLIQTKFPDLSIVLDKPYKICDYRPAFGIIFEEYLKGYQFWGHCDPDIIWGKFDHFISDDMLDKYERIYTRGHLSLYKNNDKMNHIFMIPHGFKDCYDYKYVFSTPFGCNFNEWGTKYGYAISEICDRLGVITYDNIDFADIAYNKFAFTMAVDEPFNAIAFESTPDGLFGYKKENGVLTKKEYLYLHLQKRDMVLDDSLTHTNDGIFYVIPNTFYGNCGGIQIETLIDNIPKRIFYTEWYKKRIKRFFNKLKQGALQQLIYRKLCILGIVKYRG